MWIENEVFNEDLKYINEAAFIPWNKIKNKSVLVTGGTGLIGYYVIQSLAYRNVFLNGGIKILAVIRNLEKAKILFQDVLKLTNNNIHFIISSVETLGNIDESVDYIIHGANPTTSNFFVENPVETIDTAVNGSKNLLELARKKKSLGMVYLSSMEIYGNVQEDEWVTEQNEVLLKPFNLRDSYPISKALVEIMCLSYHTEYQVPVNSLRLSQTIGLIKRPEENEPNRLIGEMVACILNHHDIMLKSKGLSKRTYVYIRDVVTAVFLTLLNGQYGETYNVSNEDSYNTIYDMCKIVVDNVASEDTNLIVLDNDKSGKYPNPNYLKLSSQKLKDMGWKESVDLQNMFARLVLQFQ